MLIGAALLSAGALSACSGSRSESLDVSGSTTILPIAEAAGDAFHGLHPDVKVLVSGLGSSAGIEAVSAGTAQIGTSSRDLQPSEKGLGLVDTPIAYDGIAVIVNASNPLSGLTTRQLRDVFAGRVTNWKQLGGDDRPIDLVNRDESSGTREAFSKLVMNGVPFDPRAAVLPGTGQVRDVVARAPGSIGYISIGFVKPRFTNIQVKALAVDGIAANGANVANKTYPIGRVLHFFTRGQPTGVAEQFIKYVLSADVQKSIVVDAGFVPIAEGARSD